MASITLLNCASLSITCHQNEAYENQQDINEADLLYKLIGR